MEFLSSTFSSLISSFLSFLSQRPALHVQAQSAIKGTGDLESYYSFIICNRGFQAATIRNIVVYVCDPTGRDLAIGAVVPRDMVENGMRIEDVNPWHVMQHSSGGYKLEPGDQWVGYIRRSQSMFSKNTKTYLNFYCSHRKKPIKKHIPAPAAQQSDHQVRIIS